MGDKTRETIFGVSTGYPGDGIKSVFEEGLNQSNKNKSKMKEGLK